LYFLAPTIQLSSAPPEFAAAKRAATSIDQLVAALPWPRAGTVGVLPVCAGSSDSWLLAMLAARAERSAPLAIVTASAVDATRLAHELGYFAPALRVLVLADWETLPYDAFSPHEDLVSERLAALWALTRGECDVLLTAASTALQRIAPPAFLASHTFHFDRGQRLDEAALRSQLVLAGYDNVSQVVRPGEYAVRGGLIDLFPMGSTLPYRIDLIGDEIESIRSFDPDTQRSLLPVNKVRLLPGREFPTDELGRSAFRGRWRERFEGDPSRRPIYRDIGNGIISAGIEYYLPLFFDTTATLFDYLPENAVFVTHGDVDEAARRYLADTVERHRFLSHNPERPVLRPDELMIAPEEFFAHAKSRGRLAIGRESSTRKPFTLPPPAVAIDRKAAQPLAGLVAFLAGTSDRVLLLAESPGRRETIAELFTENGIEAADAGGWSDFAAGNAAFALGIGPLHDGFALAQGGVTVLTETELYAGTVRRRRGTRESTTDLDAIIRDLSELRIGDPVVHAQHGIGRYQGLVSMDLGEGATEFLHLTYAGDATLYVPVAQLHVISRYSGASPQDTPLHQLGSGVWEKAKARAAGQARDTAAELLELYARRAARSGHSFPFNGHDYEAFADGFGFEETPDQRAAIHAVIQDMVSERPMDRLVCGDVGFGKTEVALRAAYLAAAGGKQVALLVPTTLLAEQHYETFSDRFANTAIRVAELSRFRSPREVEATIEGLDKGQIDIVIGTHKLLSRGMKFRNLGLVIIDEEHRFGVRHKEALKALRADVDVLTLTATPIPRTLAMSLEGIRDFSVIATAPQRRLSIKTFLRRESPDVIREAIMREIKRGGQAYFLHNEVATIGHRRRELEELLPEARIAVAHGQMHERDLENVMRDFHQQRSNVLLCTTIIETGIDVPSANTIVIHRADRFGLAQLHQLRGRVGRSHHQAYAYLMIPDEGAITRDATKRLEAIQMMEDLGAGFYLAMHDLEIRGAGEVLGESQSGDILQVGFALYSEMLDQAVRALRAGHEPDITAPLATTTEINLHVPALLPPTYCGDVHERLTIYKRLANCSTRDGLDSLQEELVDRFGPLPDPSRALIETHRLRVASRPLGICRIDASSEAVLLQFVARPPIEPAAIIAFLQSRRDARMAGPDRLRIATGSADLGQRVARVNEILRALSP